MASVPPDPTREPGPRELAPPLGSLPSLEAARVRIGSIEVGGGLFAKPRDLFTLTPEITSNLAAVVLSIHAIRRSRWHKEVELSERLFAEYPRSLPPRTAHVSSEAAGRYHRVIERGDERPSRCGGCGARPGIVLCAVCGATGTIRVGEIDYPCGCQSGFLTCPTCQGTGQSVRADVEFLDDQEVRVSRVFFPELSEELKGCLAKHIEDSPVAAWQAFEPGPTFVASAYRGAAAARAPDFHGYAFGMAIDDAATARERFAAAGDVVASTYVTTAWPFAWARYRLGKRTYELAILGVAGETTTVLLEPNGDTRVVA